MTALAPTGTYVRRRLRSGSFSPPVSDTFERVSTPSRDASLRSGSFNPALEPSASAPSVEYSSRPSVDQIRTRDKRSSTRTVRWMAASSEAACDPVIGATRASPAIRGTSAPST